MAAIRIIRLKNMSVAICTAGDEYPDDFPQQFGVGEIVHLASGGGEIYRSAIGLMDFCETGWNADPTHPTLWQRFYWVKTASDTVIVTEVDLLEHNPRPPSAAVLAFIGAVDPEQQAIREHLEMTNALWAIQRLARDLNPAWLQDTEAISDALRAIAERALIALGKETVPAA